MTGDDGTLSGHQTDTRIRPVSREGAGRWWESRLGGQVVFPWYAGRQSNMIMFLVKSCSRGA